MQKLARIALSLCLLAPLALGCSGKKNSNNTVSNGPSIPLTTGLAESSKGDTVAEVNGQPITNQELMAKIKPRLSRIENQVFDIKEDGINQIIEERLLDAEAKKRGVSVQELLKVEVQDKVSDTSDKEIQEFYDQNKARFGGKSLEEVKPLLAAQLKARKASVFRNNFIDKLMAKADIEMYIQRPRVEVAAGNGPSKGPKDAAVTVIEFTDYQCPFCARARPNLTQALADYKDEVYYVVRNFPLNFHAQAQKAAEASLCANEQKKYWDYSDKLWANQKALDVPSLKKYAVDLSLDAKKFDECLDSGKFAAEVNQDQQDGMKAGVSGTPAFFINGQMITGAQPPEAFKKVIDSELRAAKRKKG